MKIEGKYLLLVVILIILASFLSIKGFYRFHLFTFDEIVYANLSQQLSTNPTQYNSKYIYSKYTKAGRNLPQYLNKPLFKHPPLFCYLGALMQKITGNVVVGSFMPSLFFGIALIPLVYCIAADFFNKKIAALGAFLVSIDPITALCSQKIWLDTTLTFFLLLAFYFIVKASLSKDNKTFVIAAIATGLAMLSKTTGLLALIFGIFYIFLYNPDIFKKKIFWLYMLIVSTIYSPWLIWNYHIYKHNFIYEFVRIQGEISFYFYIKIGIILLAITIAKIIYSKYINANKEIVSKNYNKKWRIFSAIILLIFFMHPYILKGVSNSLNLSYIPRAGWTLGFFHGEPLIFYFRRLMELSPFYLFPIVGIIYFSNLSKQQQSLYLWSGLLITFFIVQGNFQSRYILPIIPALLILASAFIIKIQTYIKSRYQNVRYKFYIFNTALFLLVLFFIYKTIIIDIYLVAPNNVAYF
jgi:4-amino-4-deoxy-L-arabinose transferase-like glycosyltransferase